MFGWCLEMNFKLRIYEKNYGTTYLVRWITIVSRDSRENESRYGHTPGMK